MVWFFKNANKNRGFSFGSDELGGINLQDFSKSVPSEIKYEHGPLLTKLVSVALLLA